MYKFTTKNEHGISVSHHVCDTCNSEFTLCPAAEKRSDWDHCYAYECDSYDPHRDADILFMTDEEIRERKVVSIKQLRARKFGINA